MAKAKKVEVVEEVIEKTQENETQEQQKTEENLTTEPVAKDTLAYHLERSENPMDRQAILPLFESVLRGDESIDVKREVLKADLAKIEGSHVPHAVVERLISNLL